MSDGPYILITRPRQDAELLAGKLSDLGYLPLLWPLIEIHNRPPPQELDIRKNDVYAFTSANGVRAAVAAQLPIRPSHAVGPATLEACKQAGLPAQAADGDVASLTAYILKAAPTGRILHLSGRDLAGNLCAGLTEGGLQAENIPLYTAVAQTDMPQDIRQAAAQTAIKAVMLYSKRSASIFCDRVADQNMNDRFQDSTFYCLSAGVADILEARGFDRCRVAANPTESALLDRLTEDAPGLPGS